jgi:DNA-binding MarR family transcriptional regulator
MMHSYTQRNSGKFQSRGVKSTAYMTNEEKLRLVQSIYSNPKRLTIAQFIFSHKQCTAEQIIEATGYNKTTVSQIITEMKEVGVVVSTQSFLDGRIYYLSLTDTGKRLIKL